MSVNTVTRSNVIENVAQQITVLTCKGKQNEVLHMLHELKLSSEQTEAISKILAIDPVDSEEAMVQMKEKIVVALKNTSAPELNENTYFSSLTSEFSMAHPYTLEFGGKIYKCAEAAYQAQKYTDQPDVMECMTQLDAAEAIELAKLTHMTKERKLSWEDSHAQHINKDDVLMHVLRAKFGQNLELKEKLLQTGHSYLVCQGYDLYFCDNFNGTGQNILGQCLMRLRGEYQGVGLVQSSTIYKCQNAVSRIECPYFINLHEDLIFNIFHQCLSGDSIDALSNFSCVNKYFYVCIKKLSKEYLNLKTLHERCPKLEIWDSEKVLQHISPLTILKCYNEMAPHVEGDEGVAVFYYKELTMDELVKYGESLGMTVDVSDEFLKEDRLLPKEEPNVSIVTNNIFIDSRNETYDQQKTRVEKRHHCQMLTARKTVYLILRTFEISNKEKCLFGRNPLTYTRTITLYRGKWHLVIGACAPALLFVDSGSLGNDSCGAAGQRKFSAIGH